MKAIVKGSKIFLKTQYMRDHASIKWSGWWNLVMMA